MQRRGTPCVQWRLVAPGMQRGGGASVGGRAATWATGGVGHETGRQTRRKGAQHMREIALLSFPAPTYIDMPDKLDTACMILPIQRCAARAICHTRAHTLPRHAQPIHVDAIDSTTLCILSCLICMQLIGPVARMYLIGPYKISVSATTPIFNPNTLTSTHLDATASWAVRPARVHPAPLRPAPPDPGRCA